MSDHIRQTIADLQKRLAEDEQKVLDGKRLINQLSEMAGLPKPYIDKELVEPGSGVLLTIRSDQFYGQPLASCIREILEMRKALNQGPATTNEIYDALVEGGFEFDTKSDENAKRGLRISISKNTATFHKLPRNGRIGLREWYPNIKGKKPQKDEESSESEPAEPGVDDDVDEEKDGDSVT